MRAHGAGIGEVRPSTVSIGGFPFFDKLRWKEWGAHVTVATGENRPDGPSQSAPDPVQLRAYDVGSCDRSRAYRKVKWRARTPRGWTAWQALDPQIMNPSAGSADGTLCLSVAATARPAMAAYPLESREDRRITGPVGLLSLPYRGTAPTAARLSALVRWGDGRSSQAKIVPSRRGGAGVAYFVVSATHAYQTTKVKSYTITVSRSHGARIATASARVQIDPSHAGAYFFANPPNPSQNGIGLLMPREAAPDQPKIMVYQWTFADSFKDTPTVIDSADTVRGIYRPLVSALVEGAGHDGSYGHITENGSPIELPSFSDVRREATYYGILPSDSGGGVFGILGLTDDQATELGRLWNQYFFKYHIVPHLWDYTDHGRVELTTKDASGVVSSPFIYDVAVSGGCPHWPGPFAWLFPEESVCDTFTRLLGLVFGGKRESDWIGVVLSSAASAGVGPEAAVTLTVANPDKYPLSPDNTFIGVQIGSGVLKGGVTPIKAAVHSGWLGPPDPGIQPTLDQIDGFIEGPWVTSGFTAGLVGFFDYQVISSPTAPAGVPKYGAELGAGLGPGAAVGGSLDYSCSLSLSHLGVRLTSTLRRFLTGLVNDSGEPASDAGSQAKQFIESLSSDDPSLGNGLQGLIVHCNPLRAQG